MPPGHHQSTTVACVITSQGTATNLTSLLPQSFAMPGSRIRPRLRSGCILRCGPGLRTHRRRRRLVLLASDPPLRAYGFMAVFAAGSVGARRGRGSVRVGDACHPSCVGRADPAAGGTLTRKCRSGCGLQALAPQPRCIRIHQASVFIRGEGRQTFGGIVECGCEIGKPLR